LFLKRRKVSFRVFSEFVGVGNCGFFAPDCQDLYCRGVVPVIIEEDFCLARRVYVSISCDLCLPGVAIWWLTGGCQESV
jgi:hypothetical protein